MNPPALESIQRYINLYHEGLPEHGIEPHNDPTLLEIWTPEFETQLQADPSRGQPVEGRSGVYSDGCNDFHSVRVPKGANTNTPTWEDRPLSFAPAVFSSRIGMTGWNYKNKTSHHLGFDFDALVGHSKGVGITDAELERVKNELMSFDFIRVNASTHGTGIHARLMLDNIPDIENHTQHAALARSGLEMLSRETGFDFSARIDALGGNTWFASKSATKANGGFRLIKAATAVLKESDLPRDWRDHLDVVTHKRSRVAVRGIEDQSAFDKLSESQQAVPLDDQHKAIIAELGKHATTSMVSDHNCGRSHTEAFRRAHENLGLRGVFQTNSEGSDLGTSNVFFFFLPNGGMRLVRYGKGVQEAPTWNQDGTNWTTCEFNVAPTLETAALACTGIFDGTRDGYFFALASEALKTLKLLGQAISISQELESRDAFLFVDKSGHIALDIARGDLDQTPAGFIAKKKRWFMTTRIVAPPTRYSRGIDQEIFLLKTPDGADVNWLTRTVDDDLVPTSRENLKSLLVSQGHKKTDLDAIIGGEVAKPWTLVTIPYAKEFPGGRRINLGAAQYRYAEANSDGDHTTWDMIFDHCFGDLTEALKTDPWAVSNGVHTGRDYGRRWVASLLKEPFEPLPYLFFFGEENCGKSTFHEAIKDVLLIGGVQQSDRAFTNKSDFNGELLNVVLAFNEETDFSSAPQARERLKSWVTGTTIQIRMMRTDAFDVRNTLHFCHTANSREACPTPCGDTRITMCAVPPLTVDIPKPLLMKRLHDEAPYFMKTLLELQLPPHHGRLRIPAIDNDTKKTAQSDSRSVLREFIAKTCVKAPGHRVLVDEFKERLEAWADAERCERPQRNKMYSELANMGFHKRPSNGKTYLTNMKWSQA